MSEEHPYAQKPETDPFGTWLRSMHKYYSKSLDPQVEKLYRAGLRGISMPVLEQALEDHIRATPAARAQCPDVAYFISQDAVRRQQKEAAEARARDGGSPCSDGQHTGSDTDGSARD